MISWKKYSSYYFDNYNHLKMKRFFLNDFFYYEKLVFSKISNWLWEYEED